MVKALLYPFLKHLYPYASAGLCLLLLFLLPSPAFAQSTGATAAFQTAANHYIAGQQQEALQAVERGLRQYPTDPKLMALAEKLKQQQQQQQQQNQEQQQDQQGQEQQQDAGGEQSEQDQNQQGQGQEQQQSGEQQKQEAGQEQLREDENGQEQKVQPIDASGDETEKRLQEMNISPEKARMLLEAMRSNEIQYLQQKKRQSTRRPKSNKPDW